MIENTMLLAGHLVDDPELRFTPGGVAVANFRVACTSRYLDAGSGQWKDGGTLFLPCRAWRALAEHVCETLAKGNRVVVAGRLAQRNYETKEGDKRTAFELDCDEVAVSLRTATAVVTRTARANGNGDGSADEPVAATG